MTKPVPFTSDDVARLAEALHRAVADGATPGGVIALGTLGDAPRFLTSGRIADELGDATPGADTVYDIASLTKVVATWPLVCQAVDAGLLTPTAPVRDFLPALDGPAPSGEATIEQLLTHTAGLKASTRLDRYRGAHQPLHELLCREPLEAEPGEHRYVNRGYILLGLALAHTHRRPLDELARALWDDLGMTGTTYGPVARGPQVAPTDRRLPGAPRVWGQAHDDNAALLGGVAGHAGVFSTARDLARYAEHLIDPAGRPHGWLRASALPFAPIEAGLHRGLSWVCAPGDVACHHGFTGTSLYLAPTAGRYLAICTNAVYRGEARRGIAPLRALALKSITAT
ncbi:class A beta-lactamase-related serine hydrolase [Streptomyces sp. WAC07061]|uniref:serine hydrolase domain-containing protein n=1 Tax=Streptomyces sp. WAC07061 TaxID=2487410 RepID=UPI000F7B3567|nr:serine hydrolase domain-containing protein [Streptomyces sp. WAC07061]RSS42529.1 class A beta-lactamase-related serine hydrolase [Streptomyces sp. WAC07061]